jgi:O-antigen/teichoic acid export membrane protein
MKEVAIKSLKWSFIQQFATQIINYISVIILAALIEPAIQGFITIASIPIGFVGVLGSMGVREKIVKEKAINEDYKSCLLGFIVVSSILLMILSFIITVFVAWFYIDNFSFKYIIKYGLLISLIVPIGVFNHYFESFQTREMNFKGLSIINSISLTLGILISVVVAYFGYGYLGLSFKMILPHLFNLIIYIWYFRPSLKVTWCPSMYKEFKSFSVFLTFNNIANYFVRNIDYIIIGKLFSPEILGQYTIAYKILLFPMKNVTSRIQSVSMPLLAKLNIGSEDFKKKYFMIIGVVSFLTLPLMGLIALTAPEWVPITFNEKYNLLIEMIMILAAVGACQSLVSPVGTLYLLKESTRLMFINSIAISVVMFLTFYFSALTNDISIVLYSYAVSWLFVILPISMYQIYKVYDMKISTFFKTIMPSLLCTLIAVSSVFVFKNFIYHHSTTINLILSIILFTLLFLGMYRFSMKKGENSLLFYFNLITGK